MVDDSNPKSWKRRKQAMIAAMKVFWEWCRNLPALAVVVFLCWAFMLGLFGLAVGTDWFLSSEETVERMKTVLQQLGPFGDMFGAVTCLFTAGAVIFTMRSYQLQREETERSRQLFDLQLEESKRNALTFAIQTKLSMFQSMVVFHQTQIESSKDETAVARGKGKLNGFSVLCEAISNQVERSNSDGYRNAIDFAWEQEVRSFKKIKHRADFEWESVSSNDYRMLVLDSLQVLSYFEILARYGDYQFIVTLIHTVVDEMMSIGKIRSSADYLSKEQIHDKYLWLWRSTSEIVLRIGDRSVTEQDCTEFCAAIARFLRS